MKIVLFTDTFLPNVNGVVTSIVNQVTELSKMGHEIMIFTTGDKNNSYIYEKDIKIIEQKGITLPTYKDYKIVYPRFIKTIRILKEFKPDIIHVVTPFGIGWEGVIAGKYLKIPIVGTHHTFYSDYIKHVFFVDLKLLRMLNDKYTAFFFNRCNIVTSPSKALLIELKNVGVKRDIEIVANGIIVPKFKKKTDLKKQLKIKSSVMYFGRVSYEKSIDIVVKAMSIVQKNHPDFILLIVGDGPYLNEIKNLTEELNVKTIFTGFKRGQELVDSIFAGDIFVTASTSENQPMTILEAMACGKAMVGVDAKGVPELIVDGVNGLIARPDDPSELSEKIIKLMNDKKLMKRFEKGSLKNIQGYSTKNIAKKWIGLYEGLIKKT